MSDDSVLVRTSPQGVATVTLNRPEVHNAFDEAVIGRLSGIFADLGRADDVRAVVIDAAGKSFSAGADLNWMRRAADFSAEENVADARALAEMLRRLNTLPKPTVALVQGAVIAGGVGLIAACDIVVAARQATFTIAEVRLGLIPAVILPYVLAAIGARQTRRYALTAECFDAAEARRIGLVHQVVGDAAALGEAGERMVKALFAAAPGAVAEAKDLIFALAGRPIDDAVLDLTARRIADMRARGEAREGVAAFLEKRKPDWLA